MRRQWAYDVLRLNNGITSKVGNRIYQGESLDGPPQTKPFIVYRLGNTSPDNRVRMARRQYLTVYVHDEAKPGDYTVIDEIVAATITAFTEAPPSPVDHILETHWLETSADFDDREMGTILRYIRFHIIMSQWV